MKIEIVDTIFEYSQTLRSSEDVITGILATALDSCPIFSMQFIKELGINFPYEDDYFLYTGLATKSYKWCKGIDFRPDLLISNIDDVWDENKIPKHENLILIPHLGVVLLAWFTYDTALPSEDAQANLGDPGHRWITAIGPINGNQAVLNIDITSGGVFDTQSEVEHTEPEGADGTITLTFDDCNSAHVVYDILRLAVRVAYPFNAWLMTILQYAKH